MIDLLDPDWGRMPKLTVVGDATVVERGWSIPTNAGQLVLTAHAAGIFRLRLGDAQPPDYGLLMTTPDEPPFAEMVKSDAVWQVTAQGSALSIDENGRIALKRGDHTFLRSSDVSQHTNRIGLPPISQIDSDRWFTSLALGTGDAVYGLGEKWGRLNRRGQMVVSCTANAQGAMADASSKNCPFAWSPRGWGVFAHTPGNVVHGVGFAQWSHRAYGLFVDDAVLDLFFMVGTDGAEILERYTVLTGRPASLPLWSLGVWHNSNADGPAAASDLLRTDGTPGDVLIVDDTEKSPAPVNDHAHKRDFRLCDLDTPLIPATDPLHAELAAKGWLLKDGATGKPYHHIFDAAAGQIEGGLIDLTHAEAFSYWRDRQCDRMASHVDVMAADFVGPIPDHVVASNGDTGRRLHNVYPLLHTRCLHDAAERHGRGEPIVFSQTGWAGSQRNPVQRGGDPDGDWEGLAASLRGGLSWGLSGGPCYVMDVASGFDMQPDPAVHLRRLQAATFCSHLAFRLKNSAGMRLFDDRTRAIAHRFLDLRYQLLPYIEGTMAEATAAGLPAMRAMPLAFPTESEGWAFDTQYMFGPDLLVVPVVTPAGRVRAYVPKGNWVNFWTDEQISGGRRLDLSVPDEHIPVFVREGAVLPFGPTIQHTDQLGGRTRIERLVVYGTPRHAPCLARHSITVLGDRLSGVPEGVVVELINS